MKVSYLLALTFRPLPKCYFAEVTILLICSESVLVSGE